ncbi:MAG: hypothetical protein JO279_07715 [Verrucomicrobia bacterium]|nr:hypothetical protein [Verrucomicrobiota bacterium]
MIQKPIRFQEIEPADAPIPLNSAHETIVKAGNHICYAAEIIADAMARIPERDHQFFDSIIGGLCILERHLVEMNHLRENRRERA